MAKASSYFTISNYSDSHDTKKIKRELDRLHGVLSVSVSDKTHRIAVDYDATGVKHQAIQEAIEALGYTITKDDVEAHVM